MLSQPSEQAAVVATIDPANQNNSTQVSDWVDLRKFHQVLFVLLLGAVDAAITAKLREATDSSGTGAQDLTGKAMTALGASDDNKQVVFNLKAEELSVNSGYTHAALSVTIANGATNILGALALGMHPRFGPASDDDLVSVAEIVT